VTGFCEADNENWGSLRGKEANFFSTRVTVKFSLLMNYLVKILKTFYLPFLQQVDIITIIIIIRRFTTV